MVNIALHGHNPLLSEMVVRVAREMTAEAEAVGAKGIKCMGICCTGNEVLMRQGVPVLTNFLSQELPIMTGGLSMPWLWMSNVLCPVYRQWRNVSIPRL